jgi:hypothetical protein
VNGFLAFAFRNSAVGARYYVLAENVLTHFGERLVMYVST